MAKANGTYSYVVTALIRNNDEQKIARSLESLSRMGRVRLARMMTTQNVGDKERRFVIHLHRLLRAPSNDLSTLEFTDRWFAAYPSLLTTTKRQSTYKLITWVDSAAEAYIRQ